MSGPVGGFVSLVVGGITGIASLAVHDKSWAWFALAVAAPVAAVVAAPAGWWRVGFGAGWVGVLMVALLGRPEGDYVVTATSRGYALLAVGLLLLGAVVVTIPVGRRADRYPRPPRMRACLRRQPALPRPRPRTVRAAAAGSSS